VLFRSLMVESTETTTVT